MGFSRVGPFRIDHVFDSKNLQKWPPKSVKIRSNIDQKIDLQNYRILIGKMTPKRPQNGPQNHPTIGLGANLAPQKGPRGSKRASETELGRLLTDFGLIFYRFGSDLETDLGAIWDRFRIDLGQIRDQVSN